MPYMVTSTINIPQMLAYIPYMDPMGIYIYTRYKKYNTATTWALRTFPPVLEDFVETAFPP